jgi:hypothetical protein
MTVEVIKEFRVELKVEEKNTIQSARDIIRSLMNTMVDNHCEWIGCAECYGENSNYTLAQIDEADTVFDEICNIVEMY